MGVDSTGQVMTVGYDCYRNEQIGVRPVVVVDISAVTGGSSSRQETAMPEETTFGYDEMTTDLDLFAGVPVTTAPDAANVPAVTAPIVPSVPQTTAP